MKFIDWTLHPSMIIPIQVITDEELWIYAKRMNVHLTKELEWSIYLTPWFDHSSKGGQLNSIGFFVQKQPLERLCMKQGVRLKNTKSLPSFLSFPQTDIEIHKLPLIIADVCKHHIQRDQWILGCWNLKIKQFKE